MELEIVASVKDRNGVSYRLDTPARSVLVVTHQTEEEYDFRGNFIRYLDQCIVKGESFGIDFNRFENLESGKTFPLKTLNDFYRGETNMKFDYFIHKKFEHWFSQPFVVPNTKFSF